AIPAAADPTPFIPNAASSEQIQQRASWTNQTAAFGTPNMDIATEVQLFEAKRPCPPDMREALIDEVWIGLRKRPRTLVPWMPYDSDASRLLERITTLPEYYPTRTERDILSNCADAIIMATGADYSRPLRLLELGAGTAAKTGILLEAATRLRNEVIYWPI